MLFSNLIFGCYESAKDRVANYFQKEPEMISFKFSEGSGKRCINYVGDVPKDLLYNEHHRIGLESLMSRVGMIPGWRSEAPIYPESIPLLPTVLERNAVRGNVSRSREASKRQKNR